MLIFAHGVILHRRHHPGVRVKVKDLIAQLSKLDQNLEVYCFEEEASAPIENGNPGPYDICSISAEFVSRTRHSETRKPILKFEGNTPGAQLTVIIGITPEF